MGRELPLRIRVIGGLAGMVVFAGVSVVMLNYGLGTYAGGYRVTVRFEKTLSGVDRLSDVKVRGVNVGTVDKIALERDGSVRLTLKIDHGVKLADTTSAGVEPLSVFGPGFVNLVPGSHEATGPFLASGAEITNTNVTTSFNQVLSDVSEVITQLDIDSLHTVIHTIADGMAGLGPAFGQLLDNSSTLAETGLRNLPQAQQFIADLASLSRTLVDHVPAVTSTVSDLSAALPPLTARGDQLGALLDGTAKVSGALSKYLIDHQESFNQFIDSAASVLRVAYRNVSHVPSLVDLFDQFFALLGNAARLPAPGGTLVAALHGTVIDFLCSNLNPSLAAALPALCGAR